ncbi:methylthioribose-1-phosphate isomerase [Thermoactinomyces sp. DSM 45891]|uniref:S-methyl-5-thioribose-1-phosphate isomerase n=1 Tax=Thermoactinomyces sp. DSM 45891 TaxID=1761907 RepID=UPI0009201C5E|nr:S-methyl-5-thioribose-1-phosphate isomerase [Thermoactinomyces sp. DSM 45891]SFX49656.1 methylthioribose-1-phosphate isomerase [Thermoactinomyces sp. DSM 45891]
MSVHTPIQSVQYRGDHLLLLDQHELPHQTNMIRIESTEQLWNAIHALQVRGAPAIGIAAAFGLSLWANQQKEESDLRIFTHQLKIQRNYLSSARPTAVNLYWALDRVVQSIQHAETVQDAIYLMEIEALTIQREDEITCQQIGEYALSLLQPGDRILTICNPGSIATARYGTALAPFYLAQERGVPLSVYACETRPLLQGSRLTTWELQQAGVDVTLITDNMAAHTMRTKKISAIIVGCDRIAANGDTANKIGTFGLALQAKALGIPFYVASPLSTIDLDTLTGEYIPIEERHPEEVTHLAGKRIAPKGIQVYNPAFDVTPHEYISAIITEKGIIFGNYLEKLAMIKNQMNLLIS